MSCQIRNNSNINLDEITPHVNGMYDYFDKKLGFNKPPVMVFDSDPNNQSKVLGKTAYYDPSTLEVHVFTDGRHPKDMLRSIAHELVHHLQNLEGRLDVGGYMGEGYYLQNKEMRELEKEAMLKGNALMREYEDTFKTKGDTKMSLNEWKNKELNKLMLKRFGIIKESYGGTSFHAGDEYEQADVQGEFVLTPDNFDPELHLNLLSPVEHENFVRFGTPWPEQMEEGGKAQRPEKGSEFASDKQRADRRTAKSLQESINKLLKASKIIEKSMKKRK